MVAQLDDLCMDHYWLFVLIIFVGVGTLDGWEGDQDLFQVEDMDGMENGADWGQERVLGR